MNARTLGIFTLSLLLYAGAFARSAADADPPLLLRNPTVSATHIAFAYAGYIWITGREGGAARRLVTGYDVAAGPHFSPDGSMVAFTANYDGNADVYVVPSAGGEPRRVTYHGGNAAVGWTPDGSRVLFVSSRDNNTDSNHLYTIAPRGNATPEQLPLSMAEYGSYSPDATHIAYLPIRRVEPFWRGYRGGETTPVWIANLADSSIVKIPWHDSNDSVPMWVGDRVFFLSDRDGPTTLFSYDTHTGAVTRVVQPSGFDITSASAGSGAIVYAQFDSLHLYDIASGSERTIHVTIADDLAQVRPHWQKITNDDIENAGISPSGVRGVFEAHGQIFTVPAEHGDVRNVTNLPGTANRDPAWSPDGRWIAYFCDASGEYQLCLKDQKGLDAPRRIDLGPSPSFFYTPTWSPDSKKIAYADVRLNLWYVDIDRPRPARIDTSPFADFSPISFDEAWSPDSRWIAYDRALPNHLHGIFAYSLADGRRAQITDGMSDSRYPAFDKSGKFLYFTASTNSGLTTDSLDMTSDAYPVTSAAYVAVLQREVKSPLTPESDEEPITSDEPEKTPPPHPMPSKKPEPPAFRIDVDGISQRILSLPVPEANYVSLAAGSPGELYLVAQPSTWLNPSQPPLTVLKFNLTARKAAPIVQGVSDFALSYNGKRMLYLRDGKWFVTSTEGPAKPDEGAIDTTSMEVRVDPPAEWRQMYRETWRIERDFFYDPHYHGLDLARAQARFERDLPGIGSRDDLSFLFREMLSYLSVGHMFVFGGAEPDVPRVNVGLLGADYVADHGRYRIARVYTGENWNPMLHAPLTQPGEEARAGDYVLAVNGRPVFAGEEFYNAFQETAGKQIVLTVGANASGVGARQITVIPVASEFPLRHLAWVEDNRRLVDRLSGNHLAYVYMPDTELGGFTSFNRYYFAQINKQGVIIDERYNHGGQVADYIIDYLGRRAMAILKPRYGDTSLDPLEAIYGPKVMVINQFAGSGGDAMPWLFRKAGLGPLVGERTWGGLVGIGGYPDLIDGGSVTAPRIAIGGLHGHWEVENHGVAPDLAVMQDPKLVREGHDPQLEAAVATALRLLERHPTPNYQAPAYPDHHPQLTPH
jgi:tricorn protease